MITLKGLVSACYFIATKLEAYNGRGNNDLLSSRDIEDLLNVIDGREELHLEIQQAEPELRDYIAERMGLLIEHNDFDYAILACARNNTKREAIIFQRLEALASPTNEQT